MSVVGIDLGTQNTVIAVARNRGVDVITNEVSNRATPTLVGFGPKSRYLGETAKTQEISNLKNTVGALARLAGRTFDDPDVEIEQQYITAPLVAVGENKVGDKPSYMVGAEVNYMGTKQKFSATQLIAMYLSKIKSTASSELKLPVSDVVISVPPWFTDAQRRGLLDAAEIAGLKVLRLMNDTTASALGYGITKLDLPSAEENPRRMAFVDIGHSTYTASVVEFKKGELTVKSTVSDRHFGGRNFDKAMVDHFAKQFKETYKIDVNENLKARTRLAQACEKLKKVLSANAEAPMSIDSLMNDVDVRFFLKRAELEELVKPLLEKVTQPLEQALADAKLTVKDLDGVEMVGGCIRVPAIKNAIQEYFGKPLSYTMNQDEAIARGCAFSCAILSPVFRVRDFTVHDVVPYTIDFTWDEDKQVPGEQTELQVFQRNHVMPSTKILTFYRKNDFKLDARYSDKNQLPALKKPHFGTFWVKGVKPDDKGDFMICKLKARLNLHGVLNVEQGYYVEDQEIEEPVADANQDPNAMETDQANGTGEPKPKVQKIKKQVRKGDLPIKPITGGLDEQERVTLGEQENSMFMEDKLVADTEEKKNEMETFIYEIRSAVNEGGKYRAYVVPDEEEERKNPSPQLEKIKKKLEDEEEWLLYTEEGEDASKAEYVKRIEEIRFLVGPIIQQHNDKIEEARQKVLKEEEEARAKKQAEIDAKKAAEQKKTEGSKDEEMTDADTVQADGVEEPNGKSS